MFNLLLVSAYILFYLFYLVLYLYFNFVYWFIWILLLTFVVFFCFLKKKEIPTKTKKKAKLFFFGCCCIAKNKMCEWINWFGICLKTNAKFVFWLFFSVLAIDLFFHCCWCCWCSWIWFFFNFLPLLSFSYEMHTDDCSSQSVSPSVCTECVVSFSFMLYPYWTATIVPIYYPPPLTPSLSYRKNHTSLLWCRCWLLVWRSLTALIYHWRVTNENHISKTQLHHRNAVSFVFWET